MAPFIRISAAHVVLTTPRGFNYTTVLCVMSVKTTYDTFYHEVFKQWCVVYVIGDLEKKMSDLPDISEY